jgi:uncharacterized protein with GYD domain
MPFFALRWSFSSDAIKALTDKPQNREAPARQLIEGYGGKLHHYYFMFGEYDGLGIVEFPDNVSVAAASMRASSTGSFTRFETHPLMTAAEAKLAMEKVGKAGVAYKAPTA